MRSLRKLYLYGDLAEKFGKVHDVFAATIPEAITIINCNFSNFSMTVRLGNFFCVKGDDLETGSQMSEKELAFYTQNSDFHLVPVAYGQAQGKSTGKLILSIVVGGALLATGIGGALAAGMASAGAGTAAAAGGMAAFTAGAGAAAGGIAGMVGLSYGSLALMGASLLLGGISQLLSPQPQVDTSSDAPSSFTFDKPMNVNREGTAIPLIFGKKVRVGGITIASALTSTTSGAILTSNYSNNMWGDFGYSHFSNNMGVHA